VIHNGGTQTRDFVYLDDVIDALTRASKATGVDGSTINVGSGKEVSVLDLATAVAELTDIKTESVYNNKAKGGVCRMRADLTRAKQLLGYQPKYFLTQGLKKTLELDPRFS